MFKLIGMLLKGIFYIFLFPGIFITWFDFMFPRWGQGIASGRRHKSVLVQFIFAILAWFIILTI